jgi:ABC-type nitrate/sulfonate/bicarbonate transport system substrate-binding protein
MGEINIRLGGVPEHFNLPIHLAIESGAFKDNGINIIWEDYPGGTGQMTAALREDAVDLCVLLTEGIVTDIINGNPSKIVSEYVISPIIWGIHTGSSNALQHDTDIFGKQHAISRWGSGSHLMAILNAHTKGHSLRKDQFTVVGKLDEALKSLSNLETDVFYWEKFTTKPYVESGIVRRIGEYVSPWPCFVIAATDKIIEKQPAAIAKLLGIIHQSSQKFMHDDAMIDLVSKRYKLERDNTERWYHSTEWAFDSWVSDKMLKSVIYHLKTAGIISGDTSLPELIWKRQIDK